MKINSFKKQSCDKSESTKTEESEDKDYPNENVIDILNMANNFLKQEKKDEPQRVSNLSMASKNYIDEEARKNRR